MTTTTSIALTEETIAKLEGKGFRRWTKGNLDRLYINPKSYGVTYTYYANNKVSGGTFQGTEFGAYEARRFETTKAYIDVKTGELVITTSTDYEDEIREAIETIIAECTPEPEANEAEDAEPSESWDEFADYILGRGLFEEAGEDVIALDPKSTVSGNYVNAPRQGGKPVDEPTGERVTAELDGMTYERAVYQRVVCRNAGDGRVVARYVTIGGTNYLV